MSMASNIPTSSAASDPCSEISVWRPEDGLTGTLTFGIQSPQDFFGDLPDIPDDELVFTGARFLYPSYEALHKGLAPNRMAIIRVMMGAGPLSIREIARRVGRDFKGVHSDVSSMFSHGLLYKSEDGQMVFPYDGIRFDYEMKGEAQSAA
jgi:hypothetical protein